MSECPFYAILIIYHIIPKIQVNLGNLLHLRGSHLADPGDAGECTCKTAPGTKRTPYPVGLVSSHTLCHLQCATMCHAVNDNENIFTT